MCDSEDPGDEMGLISMIVLFICIALSPCALGARLGNPGEGKIKADIEYTSDAWADRVDYLPGWGPLDTFNMFAGWGFLQSFMIAVVMHDHSQVMFLTL